MIITVTPNPSIDRAYQVPALRIGEVNRAGSTHVDAGGKGINISRALSNNDIPTTAVFPCGGADGLQLVALLDADRLSTVPVPVSDAIRSNITLVDEAGITTKVNAPGPTVSEDEVEALLAAVDRTASTGSGWLVGAGSLPAGAPVDFYVRLAAIARKYGLPLALDTSGAPLAAAVAAGGLGLIKPNEEELAELLGQELRTVGEITQGSRHLMASGIDAVLVSLGAGGALLIDQHHTWWAGGPPLVPLSTVGAGDTTLAGFLATTGTSSRQLHEAVVWGRAAVLLPGTAAPHPRHLDRGAVTVVADPSPRLTLKELCQP